jgi:hypothetical protein
MCTVTPFDSPVSLGILRERGFALPAVLAAVLVATLGGARMMCALTPSTPIPSIKSVPAHKPAHPHKGPATVKAQPPAAPVAAAPATPPAPEVPKWPANEKPVPATVTWDSQGLRIEAANSSLAQILQDVATATGTKVEGYDADQRVFGSYGPGPARDVLSQLLQGSGYNFVMIGEQGQGTLRQLVLSSRHAGPATPSDSKPTQASEEDADPDDQPQHFQPQPGAPPVRPGFPPGGPRRNPLQQPRPQPDQPPSNPQN